MMMSACLSGSLPASFRYRHVRPCGNMYERVARLATVASKAELSPKPLPGESLKTNGTLYYTVKDGDSIQSVSRMFSVSVGSLTSLNRARGIDFKGAEIVPGTVLMVVEEKKNLPNPAPPLSPPRPDLSIVAKEVEMQQMKMLHKAPGGVGASIGTDLVLLVYAPWCEFCTEMLPDFNALARGLVDDPSVVVAKLRGDVDRLFCLELGVTSFPAVLAFPRTGGQPFVYGSGNRSTPYLLRFANLACRAAPGAQQMRLAGTARSLSSARSLSTSLLAVPPVRALINHSELVLSVVSVALAVALVCSYKIWGKQHVAQPPRVEKVEKVENNIWIPAKALEQRQRNKMPRRLHLHVLLVMRRLWGRTQQWLRLKAIIFLQSVKLLLENVFDGK